MDQPPSGPKSSGLFSSLSLGRASRANKESNTLAHPLLGASTSSLNLSPAGGENADAGPSTSPTGAHSRKASWTTKPSDIPAVASGARELPYKPRQRHGRDTSSSSLNGLTGHSSTATSPVVSPVNPSIGPVSTAPVASSTFAASTTSASTSSTFALPPSSSAATDMAAFADSLAGYSATSRLQLQSLKAAAQTVGLGNGSMGMSMVDAIFEKGQIGRAKSAEGGDWGEVLRILTAGKAILLLPTTPSSSLPITPQTLRDHIAFLSPPVFAIARPISSRRSSNAELSEKGKEVAQEASFMVLTLSGLLGVLRSGVVTFEASLPPDHRLLQSLRDATSRSGVLSSLRPSHDPPTLAAQGFPSYYLSPESCSLPFPPLGKGGPSPPAEGKKEEKPTAKLARINPFASFFSGTPTNPSSATVPASGSPSKAAGNLTPDRPLSPVGSSSSPRRPSSPRPSVLSAELQDISSIHSDAGEVGDGFNITAYAVSKPIKHAEIHKAISKSAKALIRDELHRLPEKVVDRVVKLVTPNLLPAGPSLGEPLSKAQSTDDGGVQLDLASPVKAAEKLQDFMEKVYDDLLAHYRSDNNLIVDENGQLKRKPSGNAPWSRRSSMLVDETAEAKKERQEKGRHDREEAIDKEASAGTELVEGVVCRLLYNRLFSPLESDDSRHDEALASRIAALNMLDLSLDHLGLITYPEDEQRPGEIAEGLNAIVDHIGDELQSLSTSSCLTPKEKMDVLIKAHKLVVDGLTALPQVELRPEGEPYRSPTPVRTDVDNTPRVEKSSFDSSLDGFKITLNRSDQPAENGDAPRTPDEQPPTALDVERTPIALRTITSHTVPSLVLPDSDHVSPTADKADIQDAMSNSVLTLHAPPMSETSSKSSQVSAAPSKAGTSGADLILPIIIFAVVRANPAQLASQLMYLRRYRSAICLTGEASYALVNLTAVVEFLEHVELADLGLGGESDKVISVADLSPIGLDYLDESNADAASIASASSRLRGRVFQVGELAGSAAGSANKVITGVLDSSWSAVRGLISPTVGFPTGGTPTEGVLESSDSTVPEPNRPLRPRQQSTFSLASVTASVASIAAAAAASTAAARTRSRASSRASELAAPEKGWGSNQEMIEVSSRPESILEGEKEDGYPSSGESTDDEDGTADGAGARGRAKSDARSIRSVSSMMSKEGKREEREKERVSLSDRLANIGALGRFGSDAVAPAAETKPGLFANLSPARAVLGGGSGAGQAPNTHVRRGSLLSGSPDRIRAALGSPPIASPPPSSSPGQIEPPLEQFMNCEVGDMRLSDIGVLLRDYRRLGNIVNALNGKQHSAT